MTTLPDLVLEHAARRPDAPAVRQWDRVVTYGELAAGMRALAAELRPLGVGPGSLVGVCLRRAPSMVTGLLGVLLAGGAYVPLDPDGPPARRAEIAADAGLDVIVVDEWTEGVIDAAHLVRVEGGAGSVSRGTAGPDDLAYVLFTSGSTGRPKGVMITHAAMSAFADGCGELIGADENLSTLGFTSLLFDVSVAELAVTLAAGGTFALLDEQDRKDAARTQRFAAAHEVTFAILPVPLLPLLDPAGLPAMRVMMTGAEAPGPEQVERWSAGGRRFLNAYGPTEATVAVAAFETSGSWTRPLPFGHAFGGHQLHVVDEHLRPVAPGEPGELLIGGPGLARGYLGRPGLTAEKFVPDPWGEPGARLYRTGDLVVRQDDGELLFLGRADRQVKIRGQRVEIGEVETVLRAHPKLAHAVVELVDGRLVAFCTPDAATAEEVLEHCAAHLTGAMLPTRVLLLPELPLLPSGKVDTAALREQPAAPARPPVTERERRVAGIWQRVLGVTGAGLDDDFFAAGDSITVMRLVAAIRDELGLEVAVEDVYAARTLGGVAAALTEADPLPHDSLPALTPAQRRLWFLDKLAPDSSAYNIQLVEHLRGPLAADVLGKALAWVATRHEVLRWRVPDAGGLPYVEVDPPGEAPFTVTDAALEETVQAEAGHRFELATGPLWRAVLVRLAPEDHVLVLTFHHAVFDGWSQRALLEDLSRAYRQGHLQPPAATFADYAAWRGARDARRGPGDLTWWREHLADVAPVLELPADRPRPPAQTYHGAMVTRKLTADLNGAARELGVTVPAVLLAGLGELLRRVTGRDDLVVGTPIDDRRHEAFQDLVGFFVEITPLRLRMGERENFADRVAAASDELLSALAHPGATLETVVEALALPRDPRRSPLVQVLFNVYNFPPPHLDLPGVNAASMTAGQPGSPFDLTVYVAERDGGHAVDCVYNTDLFDRARIETFVTAYTAILEHGTAETGRPVAECAIDGLETLQAGILAPAVPERAVARGGVAATETERLVAAIWREVLGRESVGVSDNFFDAGGTSMSLLVVQARLAEKTGRRPAVVDLFQHTTVRALASYLDGGAGAPLLNRADQRAQARRERLDQRRKRGRQ
ncbi:amino acid adenylation domain-containing protein [Nonomuraea sp. NBC_01738]|uniref:amino acid adenylation domain-containing protein n=1 Tax=Nonomuraea sp. NBC_01738 TaxID=2976003 RepID=UPI002E1571E0|nr:amino acid adenylation domain-containing protein [Nonomuraea sp. NBC_01738]